MVGKDEVDGAGQFVHEADAGPEDADEAEGEPAAGGARDHGLDHTTGSAIEGGGQQGGQQVTELRGDVQMEGLMNQGGGKDEKGDESEEEVEGKGAGEGAEEAEFLEPRGGHDRVRRRWRGDPK